MNITIRIAPGELIDRLTILEIKAENIKDRIKLTNIHLDLAVHTEGYEEIKESCDLDKIPALEKLKAELLVINLKIWKIEDNIRDCERRQQFDEEFIQIARSVYINNDQRAKLKRDINELLKSDLIEEKSYKDY